MRKVKYHLDALQPTDGPGVFRDGYFHCWGDDVLYFAATDSEGEKNLPATKAIVEDADTKAVYMVYPEFITFVD